MNFRKYIHPIIIALIILFPLLSMAATQNLKDAFPTASNTKSPTYKAAEKAGYIVSNNSSLESVISVAIQAFISILGVIFIILIIYAGYLWMTARGSEENVNKAKTILRTSIIGLIIILAAYAITDYVLRSIANKTLNSTMVGT